MAHGCFPLHAILLFFLLLVAGMAFGDDANSGGVPENAASAPVVGIAFLPGTPAVKGGSFVTVTVSLSSADSPLSKILLDINYGESALQGSGLPVVVSASTAQGGAFSCADGNLVAGITCTFQWQVPSADGSYYLFAHASGGGLGSFAATSASMIVDSTPPSTVISVPLVLDANNADFILSCSDENGSGCAVIKYRLDTDAGAQISFGGPADYAGKVTVTGDGNWAMEYHSIDAAGNTEAPKTEYLIIAGRGGTQADLNLGVAGLNADANLGLDLNASTDLNGSAAVPPPDLNTQHDLNLGLTQSDLNALARDTNALDVNVLDLNAHDANAFDANAGKDLNIDADANSDANSGLAAAGIFTIPDFNFFRAAGADSWGYFSTFDLGFLGRIKGFLDSLLAGLSGGSSGNTVLSGSAHDLNGLYIVPDLNYFVAIDSNSSPSFGFVFSVKAAIESFIVTMGLSAPEEPLEAKDVVVNGVAAKCFGIACESLPGEVK